MTARPDRLLPDQITEAPELLVLAQLDTALWTLGVALAAAFPQLCDELARTSDSAELKAARLLCDRAHSFDRAIARYRRVLLARLAPPRPRPDLDDQLF